MSEYATATSNNITTGNGLNCKEMKFDEKNLNSYECTSIL